MLVILVWGVNFEDIGLTIKKSYNNNYNLV
jgi:hypothetical protein